MEYFRNLIKLTQYFNCIHFAGGYPVEPLDSHPSVRHLDCLYEKLTLSDKVVHTYSLGKERVEDNMEMVRIAGGLSHEAFRAKPHMYTNINSVSPLKHDFPMIDGALRMARAGQVVVVTPFTLAGAMAPVTLSGAVTLSIAEALSAIALLQYVAPGSPSMIGTFTSNVDMKSGAPAFGTPEYMRATQMTGQMARFYGLPLRSSGVCAANVPDGQAMWETSNSLWAAVQSGTHMIYHAAGWLEGGLIASPEKFIMDCEVIQMIQRYMEPETWATAPRISRWTPSPRSAPTGITLAFSTRRTVTRPRSMPRLPATGATMKRGRPMAGFGRRNGRIAPSRPFWRNSRPRRWTRPSMRSCAISWTVARPRAARRPTSDPPVSLLVLPLFRR